MNFVAKTDVDLHRNSGFAEQPCESNTNSFVVGFFLDLLCGNRIRIESKTVVVFIQCADFAEDGREVVGGIIQKCQEIDIARGATVRHVPDTKQQRTFQDKGIRMR